MMLMHVLYDCRMMSNLCMLARCCRALTIFIPTSWQAAINKSMNNPHTRAAPNRGRAARVYLFDFFPFRFFEVFAFRVLVTVPLDDNADAIARIEITGRVRLGFYRVIY